MVASDCYTTCKKISQKTFFREINSSYEEINLRAIFNSSN